MRVALLAALLTLPAAMGQTQPATGLPPPEIKDGVITVRVKDSKGRPLPGTQVILRGSTSGETPREIFRHAAANAGGQVRFDKLPNGSHRLDVQMAGRSIAQGIQTRVRLEGPEAEGEIELVIRRRPVLTGRVVDERGAPMYNATVKALRLVANDGVESIVGGERLKTDDRASIARPWRSPGPTG